MSTTNRRHFLQLAGLPALATSSASAIEAFSRAGSPRLRLSVAAYSLRDNSL